MSGQQVPLGREATEGGHRTVLWVTGSCRSHVSVGAQRWETSGGGGGRRTLQCATAPYHWSVYQPPETSPLHPLAISLPACRNGNLGPGQDRGVARSPCQPEAMGLVL